MNKGFTYRRMTGDTRSIAKSQQEAESPQRHTIIWEETLMEGDLERWNRVEGRTKACQSTLMPAQETGTISQADGAKVAFSCRCSSCRGSARKEGGRKSICTLPFSSLPLKPTAKSGSQGHNREVWRLHMRTRANTIIVHRASWNVKLVLKRKKILCLDSPMLSFTSYSPKIPLAHSFPVR